MVEKSKNTGRKPLPLKIKALLFLCPIIILISVVSTLTSIWTEQKILRGEIEKRGEILATFAANNAELPIISGSQELLQKVAASLKEVKKVPFVTFYDPNFETIIHEGIASPTLSPPFIAADSISGDIIVAENEKYFEFYKPVYSIREASDIDMFDIFGSATAQKEHVGWVRVGLSKDTMKETVEAMTINGIMLAVLLVAISIGVVNVLLNIVLRPLETLFKATKDLREGEYPVLPKTDKADEVGMLTTEFINMSHAIKEREEQLMYSQKRIQDLFEHVEHAIFRLDADFNVIECNSKFAELCDKNEDFFCLIGEKKVDSLVRKAIEGELVGKEIVITARDGNDHVVHLSIYPEINSDGSVLGFDGYFIDITEQRKLEDVLNETQRLESLGLLAGGIAHDFNNILTSIIGYSELFLATLPQDSPFRENIETIYGAGEKAAALTRQLLAFSRKQVMEMKVVNLNTLLDDMTKMLGRLIGENVEMKVLQHCPECKIKADPSQIEQIIMNLAVNARDAMPNGGKLIFETDRTELDEDYCRLHAEVSPGMYVQLTVSDTGTGISPEVRKKIFEPFFTTKAKGAGTGLGLSTVYGIIKQMNGHIFVYSELDRGTTFKIYFPEVKGEGSDVIAKGKFKQLPRGSETVLVVDDEPSIRALIRDTLQPLGYHVIEAGNGEEALKVVKELGRPIDFLLTDVIMPVMGGKELADIMLEQQPDLKVLFMSGYTDDVIIDQGVLDSGTNFINKPMTPSTLSEKVRDILDN